MSHQAVLQGKRSRSDARSRPSAHLSRASRTPAAVVASIEAPISAPSSSTMRAEARYVRTSRVLCGDMGGREGNASCNAHCAREVGARKHVVQPQVKLATEEGFASPQPKYQNNRNQLLFETAEEISMITDLSTDEMFVDLRSLGNT